jgi:Tol biopolymer transport system component
VKKLASGSGDEEVVLESAMRLKTPRDWSSDGRFIFYDVIDPEGASDLWVLPLEGNRKPFAYLQTKYEESSGQFSPDGHWMAYVSNESGRREVYIQSFPKPGNKRRISNAGGIQPRWRSDGREIFYIDPAGTLTAVELTAALEPLPPNKLFITSTDRGVWHEYAVSSDGQKFLVDNASQSGVSTN